jgi:murein DD-endopeptidase MepM/ murein hydrolase activator NlpD
VYPTKDKVVDFGYGVKYRSYSGTHKGVDFAVPKGTPVKAAVSGVVVHAGTHLQNGWKNRGWGSSYGIHIVIDNNKFADGTAGYWSGYAHLSSVSVKVGDKVRKGQIIGYSGDTGRTTGPHLHFEIQRNRFWSRIGSINPQRWLLA